MVSLERKECVLMLSNDRGFVARLSKNLWVGLLPKLAPVSHFSWHPSAAFGSNAVEYCLLASGDKQRQPDSGVMSGSSVPQGLEWQQAVWECSQGPRWEHNTRGQEKWPGYTICPEHAQADFLFAHIPRLGNVDGTCVTLTAFPRHLKALPKIF